MKADDPRHGTYAGYQRHMKDSEKPCEGCRKAASDDARERRKDPAVYAVHRMRSAARSRALTRLAQRHPDEFEDLHVEQLLKARRLAQ